MPDLRQRRVEKFRSIEEMNDAPQTSGIPSRTSKVASPVYDPTDGRGRQTGGRGALDWLAPRPA
jgi:hypothetical protein